MKCIKARKFGNIKAEWTENFRMTNGVLYEMLRYKQSFVRGITDVSPVQLRVSNNSEIVSTATKTCSRQNLWLDTTSTELHR